MRTTVTIEPDVEAMLKRLMRAKGLSFKEALNSALRAGLLAGSGGRKPAPVSLTVHRMGAPLVDLTKAQALADAIEDEERIRKLGVGK